MKTILRRVMALVFALLLMAATACAAPRLPQKQGATTDAAAALSQTTMDDLSTFNDRLKDATGVRLYVATVDFLDGYTLDSYGEAMRSAWGLGDDDLLLLLAVGEDKFGSFGGEDVNQHLSTTVQSKLLSAYLESDFLRQDYDGAIRSYMPALASEAGKAWGETVSVSGLFGTATATAAPVSAQEWADRWTQAHTTAAPQESLHERMTDEDSVSGFSLGKVILTVFLLMVIFGGKPGYRRMQNDGCGCSGCGCMPFSSLLAGMGLWKLWQPKGGHRHHGW